MWRCSSPLMVSPSRSSSAIRCGMAALAAIACFDLHSSVWADESLARTSRKGPVEVTLTLQPKDLLIGDSVTLALRVVAEKDVELLMPEFGQAMERFAILDFTIEDHIDDEGRTVITQMYRLQPRQSGKQSIPPIMIEFVDHRDGAKAAPDGLDAYELLTERIAFKVGSLMPTDATAELNPPILDELAPRRMKPNAKWPWLLAGGLIIVATPLIWRFWVATRRRARRRTAYDVAIARLGRLTSFPHLEGDDVDSFFVELSAIVRWYLENRFELRAEELTTEEFLEAMSESPDLSREHQVLLRDFLHQADLVKFARFQPSVKIIEESVTVARRFLAETRQNTPLVDDRGDKPPPSVEKEVVTSGFVVAEVAEKPPDRELTRV